MSGPLRMIEAFVGYGQNNTGAGAAAGGGFGELILSFSRSMPNSVRLGDEKDKEEDELECLLDGSGEGAVAWVRERLVRGRRAALSIAMNSLRSIVVHLYTYSQPRLQPSKDTQHEMILRLISHHMYV